MKTRLISLSCLIFLFLSTPILKAQTAKEIVEKCNDHMQGKSNKGEMKMTIVRPTWQRVIQIKSWALGTEYSLMKVTAPARDAGTTFLKRGNEIWNYQPSINRTIKMPPSMMSQSWMGSDFTNDDLVKQSSIVNDYTHKLLGSAKVENYDCYLIELTPKPEAAVVWGKVKMWISKKDYLELKTEFYDEDGILVHTLFGKSVKEMGGRLMPSILEVVPADNPKKKTIVEQLSIEFNTNIDADFFSIQNLKSIR